MALICQFLAANSVAERARPPPRRAEVNSHHVHCRSDTRLGTSNLIEGSSALARATAVSGGHFHLLVRGRTRSAASVRCDATDARDARTAAFSRTGAARASAAVGGCGRR